MVMVLVINRVNAAIIVIIKCAVGGGQARMNLGKNLTDARRQSYPSGPSK
jgi:hypothetical protein